MTKDFGYVVSKAGTKQICIYRENIIVINYTNITIKFVFHTTSGMKLHSKRNQLQITIIIPVLLDYPSKIVNVLKNGFQVVRLKEYHNSF